MSFLYTANPFNNRRKRYLSWFLMCLLLTLPRHFHPLKNDSTLSVDAWWSLRTRK